MQKLSLTKTVGPNDPTTACEFLAEYTALSKSRVKDAMDKGAVWLKKQKRQTTPHPPGHRRPQTGRHSVHLLR